MSPRPTHRERALDGASVKYLRANGLSHRVVIYNPAARRPMVFVPGITGPAETVRFIADRLPEFRVYVPDLRGRGETDRSPLGSYRLDDYRADLTELLDALALDRPVVVGHSLGARIVSAWAVEARPEGPVVLVDPPTSGPGRDPYPMTRESFLTQIEQARAGTDAAQVRSYFPGWSGEQLALRAEVLAGCDPLAVAETHRGFETEDYFAIWDRLAGDIALLYGENSPVVPAAAVAELHRRNPAIRLEGVPGTGHMVPWDDLDGFLAALHRHLTASAPLPPH
ncbi:alpha/beta fold hydrolase [Nocardia sp. BMG51109]|uniref:alpha/beta fold hydrolase n=1 Tax=Nocardia sp. BMG51109 TaxID=1056816 RepID=UPI00046349C7|nr:alpha/beta hydrolase [Nocardia sp. BMG51109]